MKTLILMRHAAAVGFTGAGDKARPLSSEGREEAGIVGRQFAEANFGGVGIQRALVSAAQRTRETFECLGLECPVEFMDALYDCGTETMLQRIGEIGDEVDVLLVVAHAPAVPALSAELAWASDPSQVDEQRCWYPTATWSQFTFSGSWDAVMQADDLTLVGVHRVGY